MSMRMTMPGYPVVAAPGKIFLVGEYAVLDGSTAVVAAVDRWASGTFMPGLEPESQVVAEGVRAAAFAIGDRASALPYGSVMVNTETFQDGDVKLGLGSSAAAAVVTVGAVMELAGLPVANNKSLAMATADAAHRAAQGGKGSGADVAACVWGGVIQFVRSAEGVPPAVTPLPMPDFFELVVFHSGTRASTPEFIAAVEAMAARSPEVYKPRLVALKVAAGAFLRGYVARDARAVIAATRAYGEALRELGAASGVDITSAPFRAAAELALMLGGAAKPSGAGGGDVGIALLPDRAAVDEFSRGASAKGLRILDLHVTPTGAHHRLPGMTV